MDQKQIYQATVAHYLSPIREYLEDVTVSEIMINHADEIFIERDGSLVKTPARFADIESYEIAVNNVLQFTGKSVSDENPLIDGRLPDGSRVHVALHPCARLGTVMSIRKYNKSVLDIDWLVELGTATDEAVEYLKIAVASERNMLVAGGTSSGKTSLLNALSTFIPKGQRIVVIEDSAELQLQQDHVISMESRASDRYGRGHVGIRELFRSSLRLRPDRIIIGEVRGGEAIDMIQAMTSGHGGSMGTLHADNPFDALARLETMALMSKVELPITALRSQVASALDVLVQMNRSLSGHRIISQIAEVEGLDDATGRYKIRDIFTLKRNPAGSERRTSLAWTGQKSLQAGHLNEDEEGLVTEKTRRIFESD
ncbi:MAG: CpaF family protein [Phycisphaeraceae bacterium]|nr:CpaF family protein [Phycisphaeraceae bacterium]